GGAVLRGVGGGGGRCRAVVLVLEGRAAPGRRGVLPGLAWAVWVEAPQARRVRSLPLRGLDGTEEAVLLVVHPGGEEQGVRVSTLVAVAERECPQGGNRDRGGLVVRERAEEVAGLPVVGVDAAVAGVTDQQGTAERAEPRRGHGEPPRRVEWPPRGEPP